MWKTLGLAVAFSATVVHSFDLGKLLFFEPHDEIEDNDSYDSHYDGRFAKKKDKKNGRGTSCCVPYVANYTIVDKEGTVLHTLQLGDNGMVSETALGKVNIIANIEGCPDMPAASAVVAFDGSSALRGPEGKCENYLPYTIFGDNSRQDRIGVADAKFKRYSVDLPAGMHKVTTRPRIGTNCCGCSVNVNSAFFTIGTAFEEMVMHANEDVMINPILIGEVVEDRKRLTNPKKCFAPTITAFTILEPDTGKVIATLKPGGKNASPVVLGGPMQNVNIRVEVLSGEDMPVRSVSVLVDGANADGGVEGTCQTSSPFYMFGGTTSADNSSSAVVATTTIDVGEHSLQAIAYPGANCCGCGTEEQVTVDFNVVVLDPLPTGSALRKEDSSTSGTTTTTTIQSPPDEAMIQSQDPALMQDFAADTSN